MDINQLTGIIKKKICDSKIVEYVCSLPINYKIKFLVELINNIKNVYKFSGKAYHNDDLVSESEFSAMITNK